MSDSKESQFELRSVANIAAQGLRFFIPAYQRGYRWEAQEVSALLEDLVEFFKSGKPLYCLQPLVVAARDGGEYEVVDGQQRLTTLFLILASLPGTEPGFSIRYARHEESLGGVLDVIQSGRSDIPDFHYLKLADKEIKNFLDGAAERRAKLKRLVDPTAEKVSFLWYELPANDAIAAFSRLNAGKIPLTDVELLRSRILRRRDADGFDERERLAVAASWDRMEKRLNEDEFAAFALPRGYEPENRIELLFHLAYDEPVGTGPRALFERFSEWLESDRGDIDACWREIEDAFSALCEWHDDHQLFHLIGFLTSQTGSLEEIRDLYRAWRQASTRLNFRGLVKQKVRKSIFGTDEIEKKLEVLEYVPGGDNSQLRKVLLGFNLALLLRETAGTVRFSFHAYRSQNWDVEHIRATAEAKPDEKTLNATLEFFAQRLPKEAEEIKTVLSGDSQKDRIEVYRKHVERVEGAPSDELSNLTLLDSGTNRGYGRSPFAVKRKWIFGIDRRSTYLLPGTAAVFAKSFSPEVDNLLRWDENDRAAYLGRIQESLTELFSDLGAAPQEQLPEGSGSAERGSRRLADFPAGATDHAAQGSAEPPPELPTSQLTFLELIRDRWIEIPLIQRDYVQGRSSAKTVRETFLDTLFDKLMKGESMSLDFIYGTTTRSNGRRPVFHPVDGQQRLTTLFLLHWYASYFAGEEGERFRRSLLDEDHPRFAYRVRPGACEFFRMLLQFDLVGHEWWQPGDEEGFGKHLPDQIRFRREWLHDPTVKGALVMLDAIRSRFPDIDGAAIFQALNKIQMHVLDLGTAISDEEVYLRMNARGRALTPFENFKAWLIDKFNVSPCHKRSLDQEWLEFFWKPHSGKSGIGEAADAVSQCYFRTLAVLAINHRAGESKPGEDLPGVASTAKGVPLPAEWAAIFDQETVDAVFNALDALKEVGSDRILKLWNLGDAWFGDDGSVLRNPSAELTYRGRCWLRAITLSLRIEKRREEWLRITRNLIWNSELSETTFVPVIQSLEKLPACVGHPFSLLDLTETDIDELKPSSFRDQVREECRKLRLIESDRDAWQEAIVDAERDPLFKGQIEFLLDTTKTDGSDDPNRFAAIWRVFRVLMSQDKMKSAVEVERHALDRKIIRAALALSEGLKPTPLPWLAVEGWGTALRRNTGGYDPELKKALGKLLSLISQGDPEPASIWKLLHETISSYKPDTASPTWVTAIVEHGEVLLEHSESWKVKAYWNGGLQEQAIFLFHKNNRNWHDIYLGDRWALRNELISKAVEQGWETARPKIAIESGTIYCGHDVELTPPATEKGGVTTLRIGYGRALLERPDGTTEFEWSSEDPAETVRRWKEALSTSAEGPAALHPQAM